MINISQCKVDIDLCSMFTTDYFLLESSPITLKQQKLKSSNRLKNLLIISLVLRQSVKAKHSYFALSPY